MKSHLELFVEIATAGIYECIHLDGAWVRTELSVNSKFIRMIEYGDMIEVLEG